MKLKLSPELRSQIKALEAAIKADNAERRAAEAPLRAARSTLTKRLTSAKVTADRWNLKLSSLMFDKAYGSFVYPPKLEEAELHLKQVSARFNTTLVDLQAFDTIHNVDGAVYPRLPVLDREATVAAAKQERARMDAECRARVEAWKRSNSRCTTNPQANRTVTDRQPVEDLWPDLQR